MPLRGVYTSNFFFDLELYLGQILSLYAAKSLGQSLGQIFCFIGGQFLAQIKYQIVEQIVCVDAALLKWALFFISRSFRLNECSPDRNQSQTLTEYKFCFYVINIVLK